MSLIETETKLPPIAMTVEDRQRLGRLADAASDKSPDTADFLAREVDRASTLAADEPGRVSMGSQVEFRDDATGHSRRATLVYPEEANLAEGRLSILTPVGAALIGLSAGQSIVYSARDGAPRSLTVLRVEKDV
jgi:regulator of nucleoside diphosphate kinase